MATPPAGQSCGTCDFFVGQSCHRPEPNRAPLAVSWAPVDADDWCACWNVPNQAGIAGPTGATGADGPAGATGAKVWFVAGAGPPSGSFGADGDICLFVVGGDTVTELYQRTAIEWVLKATKFTPP